MTMLLSKINQSYTADPTLAWGRRWQTAALIALLLMLLLSATASATLANRKISGTMPPFGDVVDGYFDISPDGQYVVYRADQETDEVAELFSVRLDGSTAPLKLNGPLVQGGFVREFKISPDSSRVVYLANQDNVNMNELYSVLLGGGVLPIKLNDSLVTGGNVQVDFQISPDSSRVVYLADHQTNDVFELFSVLLTGTGRITLNGPLVGGGSVSYFQTSPDSSRVIYWADQDTDEVYELYRVLLSGGSPVKLNSLLVSNGNVFEGQISPDSSRVVYWADQDTDEVYELYSVPLGGGAAPAKLNGVLVNGGSTYSDFHFSPDSSRVVYLADQQTDDVDELFVTYDASPTYLPLIFRE